MGRNKENIIKAKKQGYKMTMKQLKKWKPKKSKLIDIAKIIKGR